MIILMTTTGRAQQRYDHRLRDLVRGTGDVTIPTDVGVPRSTSRGWLRETPTVVVSLDVTSLTTSELQQEILALRRRVRKLTTLLRLALALLRSSGFTLTHERLPDGRAKLRVLRAVDHARAFVPLPASCGSCDCPRGASMRGSGCSTHVRLTISRPVRARRPFV
ncbi:MAG TPA: hypothetical protein VKD69_00260 [Vicinamibacterales bacterium]|nr:hypothetical protein [Vicinamibacterales bacterium]